MKVAVVTGASKGIGLAIAQRLEGEGWRVLGVSRSGPLRADVSTEAGRDAVVEAVRAEGRLDLLVNNVGTNVRGPTEGYPEPAFHHVLQTNAVAPYELCRRLSPWLDGGAVVNVSSVSATRAVRTSSAAYALTKGGLEALTRYLAVEWGPRGIRVNAVAPWYVRTPLVDEVLADPEKRDAILARTPLGRIGEPEDVADAVCFLAQAPWISGVVLAVDGGFSALGS